MNQKEAVFEVIKQMKPDAVETDTPVMLTKQEKQAAAQKLFEGFKKGKIAYNHEMPSDDKLLLYISGLVSNWLRKDKRLNGQRNYQPRRPGSRTGMAGLSVDQNVDPQQLEALRALTGVGDNSEVQVIIVKRPAQPASVPAHDSNSGKDE